MRVICAVQLKDSKRQKLGAFVGLEQNNRSVGYGQTIFIGMVIH